MITGGSQGLARLLVLCLAEARPAVQVIFLLRFASAGALVVPDAPAPAPDAACWVHCLTAAAAWFLATVYVYLLNGVEDAVADRVNAVGRPIGRGELDPERARSVAVCCAAGSLLLAAGSGAAILATTLTYLGLGHLYSVPPVRLAATPFGSLAVVLAGISLTYLAGALSLDGAPRAEGVVFAVVMTLWTTFVGATAKDLSDLPGDVAAGRRPLAARWPRPTVHRGIAATALLLGTALAAAGLRWSALRVPGAAALAGAVLVAYRLRHTVDASDRDRARSPYRAFMLTQFAVHLALLADQAVAHSRALLTA